MALEANTLVAGDEQTCSAPKTNAFGAGDEITRLQLETKVCSAKGERGLLMLKAIMFGGRDEIAIETNALGTGGERVSQQTTHAFALYNVDVARQVRDGTVVRRATRLQPCHYWSDQD